MRSLPLQATVLVLLASNPVQPAQEPAKPRGVTQVEEDGSLPTGRLLLGVIGVDQYLHWPKLDNAVSDALGMQQALVDKAGFTAPVEPLLNEQATKAAILSFIEDRLHRELQPDDQLVLFFSGHGHTRVSKVGDQEVETGYLVPVDAPTGENEEFASYIGIDEFLRAANVLPARHVLVILDACHSGFAMGEAVRKTRGTEEFQRQLSRNVSRRAITSAQRDQLASDSGPLPGHSLFTGSFVDGLTWGTMDLDANGLITSSEIGLFLQQVVGQASGSHQTPDFGAFGLDDRGELIISLNNQSFGALVARATSALHRGRHTDFSELVRELEATRPNRPETLYLKYRSGLLSGDLDAAIQAVDSLASGHLDSGAIPLGQEDLWDLQRQLPFWRDVLELDEGSGDIGIEVVLKETNSPVSAQRLEEVDAYKLPPEAIYRLRVTNQGETTSFINVFLVSEAGRMKPMRLWEEFDPIFNGLKPGETLESMWLQKAGAPGIEELRLIVSPRIVNELAIPPDSKARGVVSGLSAESRDAISQSKRQTVRLVANQDIPQ